MDKQAQVLDFVKAVSHPDRLRIIGRLARQPANIREVAAHLDMPFRQAFSHLGLLEFAGIVHKHGDIFHLDDTAMEQLSRSQFYEPDPVSDLPAGLDDKSRKVLSNFLKQEVSVRQLPAQAARLQVVLEYIATAFEPGAAYTERQVNEILRGFHPDSASVRRYLVDAGLLSQESDGSRYWRTPEARS